jgi:hypothetical protein
MSDRSDFELCALRLRTRGRSGYFVAVQRHSLRHGAMILPVWVYAHCLLLR